MSKHQQLLDYIASLPVGEKISVRSVARQMNMSDGTAYRAIKQAEEDGLVSTIERVGTIRIEKKANDRFEHLTFREIANIIDGDILGGEAGVDQSLGRFIIGAMTISAMIRYFSKDAILIIGNRKEAQLEALKHDVAVLVTGGFGVDQDLIDLANEKKLPVISTTYDTFTVASILNKAMTNQLIKKKVMKVSDIFIPIEHTAYLNDTGTVNDYQALSRATGHSRFPVIHHDGRLIGVITAKDTVNKPDKMLLERLVTKNASYTGLNSSVASVAHTMIWNSLELVPVVTDDLRLLGILTREDVMKAMQLAQRQPQTVDTIEDQVAEFLSTETTDNNDIKFIYQVNPQMTNKMGTISFGVLCEVVSLAVREYVHQVHSADIVIDDLHLHYFKMVQIDSEVEITMTELNESRKSLKIDAVATVGNVIYAKAYVSCQLIAR